MYPEDSTLALWGGAACVYPGHLVLKRSCIPAGATFGAIAAYLSAPFIVQSWGWPAVFTVYGLIGFIWVVMWSMLVSERPSHRQVSLLQDKEPNEAPMRIPYRAFATYLPLWAIIIVETSHGKSQGTHCSVPRGSHTDSVIGTLMTPTCQTSLEGVCAKGRFPV